MLDKHNNLRLMISFATEIHDVMKVLTFDFNEFEFFSIYTNITDLLERAKNK